MQQHQGDDQRLGQLVQAGQRADGVVGHQMGQRARECDVIVGKQADHALHRKHQQHGPDGEGTHGAVAGIIQGMAVAAQVAQDACRTVDKVGKTRPVAADHAPDKAKQQQGQHAHAGAQVPFHPQSTHTAGDHQGDDQQGQCPVEQAGGKIPDADGNGGGGLAGHVAGKGNRVIGVARQRRRSHAKITLARCTAPVSARGILRHRMRPLAGPYPTPPSTTTRKLFS